MPDHLGVLGRQLALGAQRIGLVDVLQVLATQEVLSQLGDVRQALQAGVHEAGVSEVSQTNHPSGAVASHLHVDRFVELLELCELTVPQMEPLILLLALARAVCDFLALARELQLSNIVAPLTLLLGFCLQKPPLGFIADLHHKEISLLHIQVLDLDLTCQPLSEALDPILIVGPVGCCLQVLEQGV